jgi:prophage antirepressor-like protein
MIRGREMSEPDNHPEARVALFQSREIRRALHNEEWWFVITDIVAALTDAADPSDYWKKMRRRDPDLSLDSQGGDKLTPPPCAGV